LKHSKFILAALLCLPILSLADNSSEDAQFDESVRSFGFLSGAVYQCAKDSDKSKVDSQAMKAYTGLLKLFGSDTAFFYAASFGAGTAAEIDSKKCAAYTADFNKKMSEKNPGK
jgi:hypothetical protein